MNSLRHNFCIDSEGGHSSWIKLKSLASAALYAANSSSINFQWPEFLNREHQIAAKAQAKIRRVKPSKKRRNNIENTKNLVRKVFLSSILLDALPHRRSHGQKINANHVAPGKNDYAGSTSPAPMTTPAPVTTAPLRITTPPAVTTPLVVTTLTRLGITSPTSPPITALPKSTAALEPPDNEETGQTAITQEGLGRADARIDDPVNSTHLVLHQEKEQTPSDVPEASDASFQNTIVTAAGRRHIIGGRRFDHPKEQRDWFEKWNSEVCHYLGLQSDDAEISETLTEMAQFSSARMAVPRHDCTNGAVNLLEFILHKKLLNNLASAWDAKELPTRFDPWLPFLGPIMRFYRGKRMPSKEARKLRKVPSPFYWDNHKTHPMPALDPPPCAMIGIGKKVTFDKSRLPRKLYLDGARVPHETLRLPKQIYLIETDTDQMFLQTSSAWGPQARLLAVYVPIFAAVQTRGKLSAQDPRKSWGDDGSFYVKGPRSDWQELRRVIFLLAH